MSALLTLCKGNPPVGSLHKGSSIPKAFPFHASLHASSTTNNSPASTLRHKNAIITLERRFDVKIRFHCVVSLLESFFFRACEASNPQTVDLQFFGRSENRQGSSTVVELLVQFEVDVKKIQIECRVFETSLDLMMLSLHYANAQRRFPYNQRSYLFSTGVAVPLQNNTKKINAWNFVPLKTNTQWMYRYTDLLFQYESTFSLLHWRHNDHDSVSNSQPRGCLLNRLFRRRSKKTSKLRVTGLCAGNSPGPVNSPHKGPVTRKMFPFDDVIMP